MSLQISLTKFEGPLALLLYLIRKEEMDIMDIKIHEITSQYLDYIKMMKELDLEVAAEFILMAATLIQIKSQMLLPQYNENGEIVEVEDPRKELVQKLLEYQKYQEASKLLYERSLVGRDVWLRGIRENFESKQEEEIIIEDNGLFSLISAYRSMVKTAQKRVHKVAAKVQSIASRILEFKDRLIIGQKVSLQDLITDMQDQARQTLITFLSILELGKLGFISLYQTEAYSTLWIEARRPIDYDVISRVEEYETVDTENIAQKIFDESEILAAEDTSEEFTEESSEQEIISEEEVATDEEILAAESQMDLETSVDEGEGENVAT